MSPSIDVFDVHTAPNADLRNVYELFALEVAEQWPEDPTESFEQWQLEKVTPASFRRHDRWVARNGDGRIDGVATLTLGFTETNRDHADVEAYVRPEARGQGIARSLLAAVTEVALAEGRTLLNAGGPDDSSATSFCEALGAERKSVERKSRLVLDRVDRPLLEGWVDKARERASGYSLLAWDGPCPEEYLARFVDLTMVMNTAPRDDLEMEDQVQTPERHRESEQRALAQGFTWWTVVARHDGRDELAGYTEFAFSPAHPEAAWQEATAVDPAHRDRGLGRWLKATNVLRLLDDRPEIRYVDTFNAFSNGPMLGINVAMGFEIVNSYVAYQIGTADLAARIGA